MPYDFPASPTDGQTYSPAGGPDYVWSASTGAWLIKTSGANSAFVAKAGDVMSGPLTIQGAGGLTVSPGGAATIILNPTVAAQQAAFTFYQSGVVKWQFGKQTDDSIFLYDNISASYLFNSPAGGTTVTFGKYVYLNADPTAPLGAATKQYADASVNNRVRYDAAQSLTAGQLIQARQNIAAAPFDAMNYNGMQINGSFNIGQEKGTAGTSATGYFCDGWQLQKGPGSSVVTAQISLNTGYGPYASLAIVSVGTAQPALAAGDYVMIQQPIEGWRVQNLLFGTAGAKPITIGFWSQHARAGTWSGSIRNYNASRSCAFTYTQNVADTPEWKTVTIPGDTGTAWNRDNNIGLYVVFAIAMGSTYIAPAAGVWYAANYGGGPGQVNGVAATTDQFRLSNVIVLPGAEGPNADRASYIIRPYDQELLTCRRYLQYVSAACDIVFSGGGQPTAQGIAYAPVMRANPALSFQPSFANGNCTIAFADPSTAGHHFQVVSVAAGRAYAYGYVMCDARM